MLLESGKVKKKRHTRNADLVIYEPNIYMFQLLILDEEENILKSKCYFYGDKTVSKNLVKKQISSDFKKLKQLLFLKKQITLDDYDLLSL